MRISTKAKIKIRMYQKGISRADISGPLGVTPEAISMAMNGSIRSRKVRQAICDKLNLPYSIWDQIDKPRGGA